MSFRQIQRLLHVALQLPDYLRKPITVEQAKIDVARRIENRSDRFLHLAKTRIYDNHQSPYRKLLHWAGCEFHDLETAVRTKGIEKTLENLQSEGVYVAHEEFKGKVPICRNGLTVEASEKDFDNPSLLGSGIQSSTSGSRAKSVPVRRNLESTAEEAANELLLYETHGLSKAPLALWLPVLPGFAGVHNLLMNVKFLRPPERWFSQLEPGLFKTSLTNGLAVEYILRCCRRLGFDVPRPEFISIHHAVKIATWMERTKQKNGPCVLRTYTSSAVRLAQAAIENGLDISGNVIFTGAEPLTEARCRFIESAGVKVYSRYSATETGLIGASCGRGSLVDDMHVYLDRIALVQRPRKTRIEGYEVDSFLFSTLSNHAGKILLNTDIGDFGELTVQPCGCLFGQCGMEAHVSKVRSYDKLTGEGGMTLLGSDLDNILNDLIGRVGGSPDDFQFWESQDSRGLFKIVIAINPDIGDLNESQFIADILSRLDRTYLHGTLMSDIWKKADTLQIVRAHPKLTPRYKLLKIIKDPR
ncbi:MAG TPA: hypothetical protein VFH55_08390 [Nitrospiria bacterium]|nr:hypothetical protein [Nitrospiria bacterium]